MTTKRVHVSYISSLIAQWCSQAQNSCYRILVQSSTGLMIRLQAANAMSSLGNEKSLVTSLDEEEKVYRRAGFRTPAETALRDLFGGPTWLARILEVGTHENCHVLFVRTQTRRSALSSSLLSKVTVLDGSKDPWGWDSEGETQSDGLQNESYTAVSLHDLSALYQSIRHSCEQHGDTPILLVWESLAPLFLVHGFDSVLRFLRALDVSPRERRLKETCRILQVWSVRKETLTASQHAQLEDAANALLCISRGEMAMMRQGIREAGNVVREVLPFRLVPQDSTALDPHLLPYNLEEYDEKASAADSQSESPEVQVHEQLSNDKSSSDIRGSTTSKSARPKIKLQLEADNLRPVAATPASGLPRIFLQDNDPEFNDLDEEDPDDDLDI